MDEAAARRLKEKFAACKKTGDCKPYLLEKEKARKKNENTKPESDAPGKIPPEEREGGDPGGKPRGDGSVHVAPPEVEGPSGGRAMGEASAGPPLPAGQEEARREEAGRRRESVARGAAGAADAIRRSFLPADEMAGPGAAGPQRNAGAGSGEARPAYSSDPRSVPEMALAARTGYAATFRDQGLKIGAGPRGEPAILRDDGSPASPADLARLRRTLGEEPEAPRRRPDFFQVLPREKFADLKSDFAARPDLRATVFQDIGMTARQRDFQWSASCSGLSGNCNPLAAQASYRKGQDVAPEVLDSAWTAAQEAAAPGVEEAEEEEEFGEYTEEDRRLAAQADLAEEMLGPGRARAPSLGGLLARMGEAARGFAESAGWSSAPAGAAADARSAVFVAGGRSAPASYAPVGAPGEISSVPGPDAPRERRAAGRGWLYALAATAAAGLIFAGLRRKD